MSQSGVVAEHFEDAAQQHEAAMLGLWLFLVTELMLFGGVFFALMLYRLLYPEAAAIMSEHLHLWLGGANTALLLTSSLTMVLAVVAAREGRRGRTALLMLVTAGLGALFLGIKGYEYVLEYREGLMPAIGPPFPDGPDVELMFNLYFAATGLHALHLTLGVSAITVAAGLVWRGWLPLPARATPVEGLSLYWHFVDVVWVFLYPSLYLL